MSEEIKLVMNAYRERKLTDNELQQIICFWAEHEPDKLFDGPHDFNGTVTQRIGKKRLQLLKKILNGHQKIN